MSEKLSQADLAFEGAQGFGAAADGGRGGDIIKVTNLADSGKGSLRWALEDQDGPRIVVFEVSGEINLKDSIKVNGDVTVAGQTSPGGVTVTGAKLRVMESDVIIRGMQFRPGDGSGDDPSNRDGISIGNKNKTVENVVIDGNSFSWSIDELVTVWYGSQNVSITNNIMAEALQDSIHPKGDHSMGLVIGEGSSYVTVANNLLAHNQFRNIMVEDDARGIEFINNLIYNYGNTGFIGHEGTQAHLIGNVYMKGADSTNREAILLRDPQAGTGYYLEDNVAGVTGAATSKIKKSYVFQPSNVTVRDSSEVADHVLNNAGARYPELNSADERIIQSVIDGTGRIIDSPKDVGGYDFAKNTAAPKDSDGDGVPDSYETLFGTNPKAFDAHKDSDGNGVSNIEDYVNRLLDGFGQVSPGSGGSTTSPIDTGPADTGPADTGPADTGPADTGSGSTGSGSTGTSSGGTSSGGSSGSTGGDSSGSLRLEAEDFAANDGFFFKSLKNASGNGVLQVRGQDSGEASMVFDGKSGTYDLSVGYFDEADGTASLSVLVNGKEVDSWTWDQELGSDLANSQTRTERVIEGVEIGAGDTLTLAGRGEGKEPLRVDYLDLELTGAGGTASGTGSSAKSTGGSSAPAGSSIGSGSQPALKIEAEELNLEHGFKIESNTHASGGTVIKAGKNAEGTASTVFGGDAGIYDIAIDYFDESDGASFLEVLVGGDTVGSWTWDEEREQNLAAPDSLVQKVLQDVRIETGDAIVLQGYSDRGEPMRIDSIELFADTLFG